MGNVLIGTMECHRETFEIARTKLHGLGHFEGFSRSLESRVLVAYCCFDFGIQNTESQGYCFKKTKLSGSDGIAFAIEIALQFI